MTQSTEKRLLASGCLAAFGLALTVLFAGAGEAKAADLAPVPEVQIVPAAPDWTGFYVGGHMGLADAFTHYDYSTLFSGALNNHTRIGRINGAAPGGYAGFNYQFGAIVLGVEGDATFTNGAFRLNGASIDFLQTSNLISTVSGRAGLVVTPDTMVYGRVGYSRIQLAGVQGFGGPGSNFHHTVPGTQTGLGIEHLITNNFALRIEGTYTKSDSDLVLNQGFDHYRPSFFQVTVGLAFKLDPLPHSTALPVISWANPFISPDPRWTSIYGGGLLGIGAGQVSRYDKIFGLMGPYSDLRFAKGFLAGGDIQLLHYFVVGAAVDTIWTNSTFDDDVGAGLNPVVHRFAHIDRVSAVTGRLGFLVSPTILLYGKVGPAEIRFVPEQAYFAAINPSVKTSGHDFSAIQGGLGMETLIADHVALRIEGLYTRANHSVVIDGLQPAQTTLQPSTMTGALGLVVKY
ncbi:outer membrane protein [Methyloferula stellata]|uniref:outer membrane protein n=1 Tax=Methyloferula stellata TaxID=876270 RepID=UPI0003A0598C|nr:outer membrane beta-barrel protein [Methyloferula stellata]